MKKEEIKDIVIEEIKNVIGVESIDHDEYKDLGADSLDCVEIVINLENRLNINFTDEELIETTTVSSTIDLIFKKLQ